MCYARKVMKSLRDIRRVAGVRQNLMYIWRSRVSFAKTFSSEHFLVGTIVQSVTHHINAV